MRRRGALSAALLIVSTSACTVGPDYVPPQPDLPVAYDAPVPALFRGAAPDGPWWAQFNDPVLDTLVRRGLETNLGIGVAASRVREARAVARGVDARRLPSVAVSGSAAGAWLIDDGDEDDDERGLSGSLTGLADAVWDADLFGGIYRSRQTAWAEAERQEALRREARRVTSAEIARTYVELRAAERRLALTTQSLELLLRTLELVEQRVESGLAPGLDRVRARAAVALLRADLGPLRSQIDRFRNALAVLLASAPGALDELLAAERVPIPQPSEGAEIGFPMDLVRRRPDVQAAELLIAASTAAVGIAVADLYPRLTLPGTISVGWTGFGAGSAVTSALASIAALVAFPLYDGGARDSAVTAAEERVIQATLLYRQTLLGALEEVESALLGYQGALAQRRSLIEAVQNNRLAYEQSQELYRQGFVTFIDVLDSQRQWNESLQELALAERDLSLEVVNLYTALGGDAVPQS